MKKLLLALTIAAGIANAGDEIGRVANNAGGAIVFTKEQCRDSEGIITYGYSGTSSDTVWGCATPMGGAMFVRWQSGKITRYPYGGISWSEEFARELKKNRQTY